MIWTNLALIVIVIVCTDICGYINYYRIKRFKKGKDGKEGLEKGENQPLGNINLPKYLKNDESSEESVEDDENMKFGANNVFSHHSNKSIGKSNHNDIPDLPIVGFANLVDNYKRNSKIEENEAINNQQRLIDIEKKQAENYAWNNLDKEIGEVLAPSKDVFPISKVILIFINSYLDDIKGCRIA